MIHFGISHTGSQYFPLNEVLIQAPELGFYGWLRGVGPAYLSYRVLLEIKEILIQYMRHVLSDAEATFAFEVAEHESLQHAIVRNAFVMVEDYLKKMRMEERIYQNVGITGTLVLVANTQALLMSVGGASVLRYRAGQLKMILEPLHLSVGVEESARVMSFVPLQVVGMGEWQWVAREVEYFDTDVFMLVSPSVLEMMTVGEIQGFVGQMGEGLERVQVGVKEMVAELSIFLRCIKNMSVLVWSGKAIQSSLELGAQIDTLKEDEGQEESGGELVVEEEKKEEGVGVDIAIPEDETNIQTNIENLDLNFDLPKDEN